MLRLCSLLVVIVVALVPALAVAQTDSILPALEILNAFYIAPETTSFEMQVGGECVPISAYMGAYWMTPFTQPYSITVHQPQPYPADPCTGPVLALWPNLDQNSFYSVLIYTLSDLTPGFALHTKDGSPIGKGKIRLHVHNGYHIPVDVMFHRNTKAPADTTITLPPGGYQAVELNAGNWDITLNTTDGIPYQFFSWDVTYHPIEHWLIEIGGPVNDGVIGIWDFPYDQNTKWRFH